MAAIRRENELFERWHQDWIAYYGALGGGQGLWQIRCKSPGATFSGRYVSRVVLRRLTAVATGKNHAMSVYERVRTDFSLTTNCRALRGVQRRDDVERLSIEQRTALEKAIKAAKAILKAAVDGAGVSACCL